VNRLSVRLGVATAVVVIVAVAATYATAVIRTQAAVMDAERLTNDVSQELREATAAGTDDATLAELVEQMSRDSGIRLALESFSRGLLADTGPAFGLAPGERLPPDPTLISGPFGLPESFLGGDSAISDAPGDGDVMEPTVEFTMPPIGSEPVPATADEQTGADGFDLLEFSAFSASEPLFLYVGIDRVPIVPVLRFDSQFAAMVALILALACAAAVGTARRIVAPVDGMTAAAAKIAGGDLAARVDVQGHGELAALSTSFNTMAGELEADAERRRTMTDDINHELRSPLTNVRSLVSAARDGLLDHDEALAALDEETGHLAAIIADLDTLIRSEGDRIRLRPEAVDLDELVSVIATAHTPRATDGEITLEVEGTGGVVSVDIGRMRQVIGNLIDNALRHTEPGGSVRLHLHGDDDHVTVEVIDTGTGIAPEHLPRVFERFYRADAARGRERGGTGLGLAVAYELVAAHGGTIKVESVLGQGSTFTIRIPRE
jgi:signal transduction histidine kinase